MVSRNGHESSVPLMIIAMKGSSSSKKTEIATKLAAFLRYPLIDEGDVISALESSDPPIFPSTEDDYKDLPFEIVSDISSTQLRLKLNVIMNSELSQRTHFEHLVQMASSKGASLLIVDCEVQNGGALYDVGDVPKLSIDITKPFVVEEFVPAILRAVGFPQGNT